MTCEAGAGTLAAGSTPSRPLPVPWPGGCGGKSVLAASLLAISVLAISVLAISVLAISVLAGSVLAGSGLASAAFSTDFSVALATTAFDVSGTSARAGGMALVMGGAGCGAPAEASFTWPALTCTVLTLTGFIGSDEPGMTDIGWVWITPDVSGAGCSTLACGDGMAAVATAIAGRRGAGALE